MSKLHAPPAQPTGDAPIRIKPHHLVDIISDFGAGQPSLTPSSYGHALHLVTARVLADPELLVVIELGADDVCAPCIHNKDGKCDDTLDYSYLPETLRSKGAYNLLIDQRWCKRLQLRQNDMLSVKNYCQRLTHSQDDLRSIYAEESGKYAAEKACNLTRGIKLLLSPEG